jgi:hypothetical protein
LLDRLNMMIPTRRCAFEPMASFDSRSIAGECVEESTY